MSGYSYILNVIVDSFIHAFDVVKLTNSMNFILKLIFCPLKYQNYFITLLIYVTSFQIINSYFVQGIESICKYSSSSLIRRKKTVFYFPFEVLKCLLMVLPENLFTLLFSHTPYIWKLSLNCSQKCLKEEEKKIPKMCKINEVAGIRIEARDKRWTSGMNKKGIVLQYYSTKNITTLVFFSVFP